MLKSTNRFILYFCKKQINHILQKYIGLLFLIIKLSFSQDYSADSLIITHDCNFIKKTTINVIAEWQKISYFSNILNCQFYPSCSNYFSLSIAKKGLLKGSIIGLDRIVRCNPAAVGYHLQQSKPEFHYDGRLVDNLYYNKNHSTTNYNKWPVYLSIIPGMGRIYLGHKFDGIVSLAFVSLFSVVSYHSFYNNNNTPGFITGILASFFWAADYYGAYRTAELNNQDITYE